MKLIPERGNVYHWEEHDSLKLYPDETLLDGGLKKQVSDTINLVQLSKN